CGELQNLRGARFAFRARCGRNESYSPLYRRNVSIAFTGIGRKHRGQRKSILVQRRFPIIGNVTVQLCAAINTKLAARHAERFDFAQVVPAHPKHYADFHRLNRSHEIFSPFLFRASSMSRISFTAAADSAGGQRTGCAPDSQQSTKYWISAVWPSQLGADNASLLPSARYSVGGRPSESNSIVPPSDVTVYSIEN